MIMNLIRCTQGFSIFSERRSFDIGEKKFQKTEATYYNEVIKIKFFELIQREVKKWWIHLLTSTQPAYDVQCTLYYISSGNSFLIIHRKAAFLFCFMHPFRVVSRDSLKANSAYLLFKQTHYIKVNSNAF